MNHVAGHPNVVNSKVRSLSVIRAAVRLPAVAAVEQRLRLRARALPPHPAHAQQFIARSLCRCPSRTGAVQATYEDANFVHIVMELCVGGELFDSIVESGSYTERKAAACFRKMVDMLHHCHELGVMHRDLKPENFLLTSKTAEKCALLTVSCCCRWVY